MAVESFVTRPPAAEHRGKFLHVRQEFRERIDQAELRAGRQQRLLLVLAVNVTQISGQVTQQGQLGWRAVDIGATLAICQDLSLDDQFALGLDSRLGESGHQGGIGGRFENPRHAGAPRARAHHVDTGARTEEQRERVHDDGFATPRLSGEEIQARLEREAEAVHHCVALDIEFLQHAAEGFGDGPRRNPYAPGGVQSA